MLAPACWVDALLFFDIIKSNYTMDRQLCYRKKPRGPRGLQLSKGSFNVTSLTVHNVHITYNISSTLWEKHKLRPTLGYLPVRVFKKVYLNNSYIKSQKRRNIVEMVNSSIGPLKKVCQIPEYNAFCMRFSKRIFSVSEHVLTCIVCTSYKLF